MITCVEDRDVEKSQPLSAFFSIAGRVMVEFMLHRLSSSVSYWTIWTKCEPVCTATKLLTYLTCLRHYNSFLKVTYVYKGMTK